MKKYFFLLIVLNWSLICSGQVTLIGHAQLNNVPLKQVSISIKVNGITTKTLNTLSKSEFKLVFDYGKIYEIYFQHPNSPVMHMQVIANTLPPEKYYYLMGFEMVIPFVYKYDEDVDTSVYKNPFFKITYDDLKSMVADTAYNNAFEQSIIMKPSKGHAEAIITSTATEVPGILTGKFFISGDQLKPAARFTVTFLNKSGEILKSGSTNNFGVFAFSGVVSSQVSKISLQIPDSNSGAIIELQNSRNKKINTSSSKKGLCEWNLTSSEVPLLRDNNFVYNIGGKLVSASIKEKKFYAEKHVYLLNKHNTILKKTTTTLFGTFVFEDIRPDVSYCLAIEQEGLMKGEKIDLLSKGDVFLATIDSNVAGKFATLIKADNNKKFQDLCVNENEMKMDIKATIFGDNINQPIGRLKIILLNDNYEVIDSAITDDFGTFKFKYLPFLKRFFLSAENTDNVLDVFKNILIYSEEENLIKIMTHQKGAKFAYKPVSAELSSLRAIELEDPWLEFVGSKNSNPSGLGLISKENKLIVENIMFEAGKYDISEQAKEILDKVILVLNTNKNLKIEVGAHTDSKGNAAANLKLSEQRAKTVVDYITHSSIGINRISAKGYGETQLLNHCKDDVPCSEEEHAHNRRIEFKILGEQ